MQKIMRGEDTSLPRLEDHDRQNRLESVKKKKKTKTIQENKKENEKEREEIGLRLR